MAAQEVIHFLFWAQLSRRSNSPALPPPEPVAEPPPELKQGGYLSLAIGFRTAPPSVRLVSPPNANRQRPRTGETKSKILSNNVGAGMTKTDAYIEIVLWNQCMDRLIRVLGRLELHLIRSRRELREYAIRLEEVRAGLNADFAETMAARERADEFRFWTWRTALKKQTKLVN
jgi:hypothetical protein